MEDAPKHTNTPKAKKKSESDQFAEIESKLIEQQHSWIVIIQNLINTNHLDRSDSKRKASWKALFYKFLPGPGTATIAAGGVASLLFLAWQTKVMQDQNELIYEMDINKQRFNYAQVFFDKNEDNSELRSIALNAYIKTYESTKLNYDWSFLFPNYIKPTTPSTSEWLSRLTVSEESKFSHITINNQTVNQQFYNLSSKQLSIYENQFESSKLIFNTDTIEIGGETCSIRDSMLLLASGRVGGKGKNTASITCDFTSSSITIEQNRSNGSSIVFKDSEIRDSNIRVGYRAANRYAHGSIAPYVLNPGFNPNRSSIYVELTEGTSLIGSNISVYGDLKIATSDTNNSEIKISRLTKKYYPNLFVFTEKLKGKFLSDEPVYIYINGTAPIDISEADISSLNILNENDFEITKNFIQPKRHVPPYQQKISCWKGKTYLQMKDGCALP